MSSNTFPASTGYASLTEANDPLVLSPEVANTVLAKAPWQRFAVVGDSIARGTGDPWPGYASTPWADRVAHFLRMIQPSLTYLNTGEIGATIEQVRAQQVPRALDFGPNLLHVSCGGNDLLARDVDLSAVERRLDELCDLGAQAGAQLSLLTHCDNFTGRFRAARPRFEAFCDIVRRGAARLDAILTDIWDHPARHRTGWLSNDELHFTMAGHAVLASDVVMSLAKAINSRAEGTSARRGSNAESTT